MLLPRHKDALQNIKEMFKNAGYELSFQLLNASDYNVPQDRKRVFFIGIRKDLGFKFEFPTTTFPKIFLGTYFLEFNLGKNDLGKNITKIQPLSN